MRERRILMLSFHYRPDLSAGSFCTTAFVESLLESPSKGPKFDVITTLPNRYSSFRSSALEHEEAERLDVRRISLATHQSGMLDQVMALQVEKQVVPRYYYVGQ